MTRGTARVLAAVGAPLTLLGLYITWWAAGRRYFDAEAALHATLIGGGGLALFAAGVGGLTRWRTGAAVFAVVAVPCAVLLVRAARRAAHTADVERARATWVEALWPVCGGQGVAAAAELAGDGWHGPRPTVAFTRSARGDHYAWLGEAGRAWLPRRLGDAQLVACFAVTEALDGECPYAGGARARSVPRLRYAVTATLREARTARVIAVRALTGGAPPPCPPQVGAGVDAVRGPYPSDAELRGLVRAAVESE